MTTSRMSPHAKCSPMLYSSAHHITEGCTSGLLTRVLPFANEILDPDISANDMLCESGIADLYGLLICPSRSKRSLTAALDI